jgi:hypothetical protein
MNPIQDVAPKQSLGPSVQRATDAVVASYIHAISARHRPPDERSEPSPRPAAKGWPGRPE